MNQVVVGIADCRVSSDPEATLVTYALGSCIAVAIYDPVARIGGLLHYLLPDSSMDSARGKENPCLYADTGVPRLLEQARSLGANVRRLKVRVAGGAQVVNDNNFFEIGKRNYLSLKKVLWKAGLMVEREAVGGTCYRTVWLSVQDGDYKLREGQVSRTQPQPQPQFCSRREEVQPRCHSTF